MKSKKLKPIEDLATNRLENKITNYILDNIQLKKETKEEEKEILIYRIEREKEYIKTTMNIKKDSIFIDVIETYYKTGKIKEVDE
nr:MAG TPA: hypothetical protein [Caudoviricetes sp.]